MSDSPVSHVQHQILEELVKVQAITKGQAGGMAPSESMGTIVHDILRMASGKEDAVAAAVGKVRKVQVFDVVEEGRPCYFSDAYSDFVIYDSVVYTPNPFDGSVMKKAAELIRRDKLDAVTQIGVIGAQKLVALRQKHYENDDEDVAETNPDVQKELAKKLVHDLLRDAASRGASDIHFQPSQQTEKIQIRYRVDGRLRSIKNYPIGLHDSVVRVIIDTLSGAQFDATQPQDTSFMFALSLTKEVEVRVSTIPAKRRGSNTQKVVLRLLDNSKGLLSLADLGMSAANTSTMKEIGALPAGLFVMTGPTGSGKTTTLATALLDAYHTDPDRNFHTLEDPVEMRHEGMTHTECGKTISFPKALRSILRQDPDVILVGEVRDLETAELAFQATQTGHLVFASLHTRNSHGTIDRLLMMGIPRDIIATSISAIAAQRLVGTLCPHCRVKTRLADDSQQFAKYGSNVLFAGIPEPIVYKANPNGCSECKAGSNGMKGRAALIEILRFTPEIQDAILDGSTARELRRLGLEQGSFLDLWDDGIRLVLAGITTFEALERCLEPYWNDRSKGKFVPNSHGHRPQLVHSTSQAHQTLQPHL